MATKATVRWYLLTEEIRVCSVWWDTYVCEWALSSWTSHHTKTFQPITRKLSTTNGRIPGGYISFKNVSPCLLYTYHLILSREEDIPSLTKRLIFFFSKSNLGSLTSCQETWTEITSISVALYLFWQNMSKICPSLLNGIFFGSSLFLHFVAFGNIL